MSKPGFTKKVMAKLSQLSLPYPRSKKNKINNVSGDNNNNSSERKHDVFKKRAVMKLDLHDERVTKRAVKTVSSMSGIYSIQIDGKDNKMIVVADTNPAEIVGKLRKLCQTDLLLVQTAKKPEDKKGNKINNVSDGDGDGGSRGGDGNGGSRDSGGDASGDNDGGDNDGGDHTEGSGGGKMGTEMQSMGQPDFRDFRNNAGDENGYPVGQLHRRNYEKPNVCSIIPYEKNILIATAVMAEAEAAAAAAAAAMAMMATAIIMVGIKLKGAELVGKWGTQMKPKGRGEAPI